jgi:hypothetical protein
MQRARGEGPPYLKLGDSVRATVRYRVVDIIAWEEAHQVRPGE